MRPWDADGPATTLRECGDLPRWVAAWCLARADLTGFGIRASPLMPSVRCRLEWGDRAVSTGFPVDCGLTEWQVEDVLDRIAAEARKAPRLP
jgi:hypothetical protein